LLLTDIKELILILHRRHNLSKQLDPKTPASNWSGK